MNLADITHQMTDAERSYTSTGAKLAYHKPIFDKYRETGYGSIIRATMTLHQSCSSKCSYCSTAKRTNADSTTLDEAKAFVTSLYDDQAEYNRIHFPEWTAAYKRATGSDIQLRGLILSGGGQPNLWGPFAEFVDWLSEKDIDLGLITNGFPVKVPESVYGAFKWIRISITPEHESPHYVDGRFDLQYLPKSVIDHKGTVGYSYVYGSWTTDDILGRIHSALDRYGFDYCRTLADCNLPRDAQLASYDELSKRLIRLGFIDDKGRPNGRIYMQLKAHGTQELADDLWNEGQCFLQIYTTFWDTTGHHQNGFSRCYPCDSVTVLAEEGKASERRFTSAWATYKNTEVHKLFTEPVKPFFDPRSQCSACLFTRNNDIAKRLIGGENIPVDVAEHLSFP